MAESFVKLWNQHVDKVEGGLSKVRRSSAISLMPELIGNASTCSGLKLHLDLAGRALKLVEAARPVQNDSVSLVKLKLDNGVTSAVLDGIEFTFDSSGHEAYLAIYEGTEFFSKIKLRLTRASLTPVYPRYRELHAALRNMSGREVDDEWDPFVGRTASWKISSGGQVGGNSEFYLELVYENRSMERDAAWLMTLVASDDPFRHASLQVTHAPFSVSRFDKPRMDPEGGEMFAQWLSNDPEGAQWRFAVETVTMQLPPQAIGETMERGARLWGAQQVTPIDDTKPVLQRFSRCTQLTVKPSRLPRRYTVHPGDLLTTLKDAQLERLTVEVGYPLELTYARTERATRTVVISEVGGSLGKPAISLAPDLRTRSDIPECLSDSMSDRLAQWYGLHHKDAVLQIYHALRRQHLANRASLSNRLAVFTLMDGAYPDKPLNLAEELTARLRSTKAGAPPVFPLALDELRDSFDKAEDWVADFLAPSSNLANIRKIPIGLLYTLEFASELRAVLRNPLTSEVRVHDLSLSALGASGTVQASFDNGRTTFEVSSSNGQAWRIVKSRVGRIGAAWNRARHVVVYGRSTVPSRQFVDEQEDAKHPGRPLLRKLEEYIEILEPQRMFSREHSAQSNRCGCLHSFCFATERIYVNSAWGCDLPDHNGYEIALYNPDDSSGFYVKPWLGPVTFDANEALVHHWHEHPEDVYFYSNSEEGVGSDTDVWPSKEDVDYQARATFSIVAPAGGAGGLLGRKVVPDYSLAVAENPRFTMRVTPQGQANIAHGRGDKALLASLRSVQIERTSATSRVDLRAKPFQSRDPKQTAASLFKVVAGAAEARNIEAVIASLLKDARQLLKSIGSDGCMAFKERLTAEVDKAFKEAKAAVDTITAAGGELAGSAASMVDGQLKEMRQWLARALNGDTCKALVRDLASNQLQALRQVLHQILQQPQKIDGALAASLTASFQRELAAVELLLNRLVEPLSGLRQTLAHYASGLSSWQGHHALATEVHQAREDLETYLSDDPAAMRTQIDTWIAVTKKRLSDLRESVAQANNRLEGEHSRNRQGTLGAVATQLGQWGRQIEYALNDASRALTAFSEAIATVAADERLRNAYDKCLKTSLEALDTFATHSAAALDGPLKAIAGSLNGAVQAIDDFGEELRYITLGSRSSMTALKDQLKIVESSVGASIKPAVEQLDTLIAQMQEFCAGSTQSSFAALYEQQVAPLTTALDAFVAAFKTVLEKLKIQAESSISSAGNEAQSVLTLQQAALLKEIGNIDCAAADALDAFQAGVEQTAQSLRDRLTAQVSPMLDELTQHYAGVVGAIAQEIPGAIGKASAALKSIKMLIEPPEIPHFSINTRQIECVFDDLRTQIETSPFVARLNDLEGGIRDLGMALPVQGFQNSLKMLELQGLRFNQVIKQAGMDFEALLKKFQLPSLPDGTIRFSHQVDAEKRIASARVEVDHTFTSTEQLFNIAGFSMDVRQPRLQVESRLEATEFQAITRTQALFGGDWIMNFGGQPLVTFRDSNVQYSDSGGFRFDLDPRNVYPHPALLFITQAFQTKLPKLPEGVKVEKDAEGHLIGVSLTQESTIGPYDVGSVSIGEATIRSAFAVRMVCGEMSVSSAFDLGTSKSPVFMQVGVYGGGGWLNARAGLEPDKTGALVPSYSASMAVSLGSTRSFTLASVASGSYAVRLYLEATISSQGGNRFAAGLSVVGSARLLGYLNAYLSLALEVEHSDGKMEGRGRIDVEIEICWCYSARISRAVKQKI